MNPFLKRLSDYRVIALIGAGGKTSICRALTHCLPGSCLYTTTTHMIAPLGELPCLNEPSLKELEKAPYRYKKAALCGPEVCPGSGKVSYPGDAAYALACRVFDHVIVEADGARGRQLKIHGSHVHSP